MDRFDAAAVRQPRRIRPTFVPRMGDPGVLTPVAGALERSAPSDPPPRPEAKTRVLDGTGPGQPGSKVSLAWKASGLVCGLELPLKPGSEPVDTI